MDGTTAKVDEKTLQERLVRDGGISPAIHFPRKRL
jgi:hypothetical protein